MPVRLDGSLNNAFVQNDANIGSISGLAAGSISIWFKVVDVTAIRRIFTTSDIADASSDVLIQISGPVSTDEIELRVRDQVGGNVLVVALANGISDADDGNWHHFVYTTKAGENKFYFDGADQAASVNYTVGNAATQAFFANVNGLDTWRYGIGEDSGGLEGAFDGCLTEAAIWSVSLSAAEVLQLYKSRMKHMPLQVQPANLVSYHPLDDVADGISGISKSFVDMSGNNLTATGSTAAFLGEAEEVLSYQPYIMAPGVAPAAAAAVALIAERGPFRGINRGINRGVA